ncbi:MAG: type I-E CRISPR-associated protein Cse2/CasB [Bacillota bacterium]|jgi:CRISPR system Cascade subunit CasB|nr:MAG: type I-E CRISPR-associated protein Cse2/CasB [Bacillota bacterium]
MNRPKEGERAFVSFLEDIVGAGTAPDGGTRAPRQRAAAAALRRGLGKPAGTVAEMYPYVEPWLSPSTEASKKVPYYTVAALLAWHPLCWHDDDEPASPSNLGASFARLVAVDRDAEAAVERRFVTLLDTRSEDLPQALRQAVGLLRSRGVAINWTQLLADLECWDRETREVQRRWARAFWGGGSRANSDQKEVED